MLTRPAGRPPNHIRRSYANFHYQSGSCTKPRRAVAKVEWHPGERVPASVFIVTNMARVAEKVVGFYDKRGTCDQGGQTLDQMDAAVTPFVCTQRSSSLASCARLQSRQFPSHPRDAGADQGMVADKPEGKPKVVSHGRYVAFQLGPRWPFREICSADALRMISELRPPPVASTR